MKMSKVIIPLVATAALGYAKKKFSTESVGAGSDLAKVASESVINEEKSFGGLTQSIINEIVSATNRGIKAEIVGDTLEYCFGSNTGKKTATAIIKLDSKNGAVFSFLPYGGTASSPNFFIENLRDAMNVVIQEL